MITEIESDIPGAPRMVYYKVTDDFGVVTRYGPVMTNDAFDAVAYKSVVQAKVTEQLAVAEFGQVIG